MDRLGHKERRILPDKLSGAETVNTDKASPRPTVSAESGDVLLTIKNLWPYMWPSGRPDLKQRVVLAIIMLVASKILMVVSPFLYKWATDTLAGGGVSPLLPLWLVTPVMLVIAYNVIRFTSVGFAQIRDALFSNVSQHAVRQLAMVTFRHMHALSLRYHLQRRTGSLSRVIERGVKGIDVIVRFTILNSAPIILEFILVIVVVWYQFDFWYVLAISIMVWIYAWFSIRASDWRINIRREMNRNDTEANAKAVDSLLNFETVKYFGNEETEAKRFDFSMAKYEKATIRVWTSLSWFNLVQTLIISTGIGVCMAMSAIAVSSGYQTMGDFVMINALLMQLAIPLDYIGFIYREIRQGLTDIEEMFLLLDVEREISDVPNATPLKVKKGAIRFSHVDFYYEDNRKILNDISFEVAPGKTVAIVGPSGAGKSTISRLLFRFYDVNGGAIEIDGQNISMIQQHSLRAAIGVVPQDTVLFNETIAYNIRYGRVGASDEEVIKAAKMAKIHNFIKKLPDGYNTEVGERGLKLSGGEKQRVAIARTLLKAPPIMILDEATSALDTHTEREIQHSLDMVSRGRTTLVIAHRLSTVVNADEIIVLENGEITERGTHKKLLAIKGLYAEMWDRQREETQAEEQLRKVRRYGEGEY